jgi:hypothetical protein
MTKASAEAAAIRARSTADRLADLRERLDRLAKGDPTTAEDVQRARQQALAQARAMTAAQERLLRMHRSAAARHQEHAQRFASVGRAEAAEREHEVAQRSHDAVERYLGSMAARRGTGEAGQVEQGEVQRLRVALAAQLAWAGKHSDLDEVDRRQEWSRAVVDRCGARGWRGWIHAVCAVAEDVLAPVQGVAVTVVSSVGPEFAGASNRWTARVQELELVVGEGPSTTAQREDRVVVVEDLAVESDAWPGYTSSSGRGVRGVWAVPVHLRGMCVGSLTVYGRGAAHECRVSLEDAAALADIAAGALLADLEAVRGGEVLGQGRFAVHVATGALAARHDIPVEEAEARIRAHAFSSGHSLTDVAEAVLSGRLELG